MKLYRTICLNGTYNLDNRVLRTVFLMSMKTSSSQISSNVDESEARLNDQIQISLEISDFLHELVGLLDFLWDFLSASIGFCFLVFSCFGYFGNFV